MTELHDIRFRSDMTVDLVKHSASDMDIVWAARVSTNGERAQGTLTSQKEASGLINFLMRERHGTPFEHSTFTFFVSAPIFVWREHMRHRIASYNEESGRYRALEPVFYIPDSSRDLQQVGKAGKYTFLPGTYEQRMHVQVRSKDVCRQAYHDYQQMLHNGIAREVARIILPLNIYSSAYVTMNARALMNFLSLRTKDATSHFPSYPQREIEMVAEGYERIFQDIMPMTHEAFCKNGRVAP
jgi:thymidylate synthase (FAD)